MADVDQLPHLPIENPPPRRPGIFARYWTGIALWKRIFAALVLGVIAGLLFGEAMESLKWMGDLFIRLIRMLVAPLVLVVVIAGLANLGDPRRLGTIGLRTLVLYLLTTIIAVFIGLAVASLIQPGLGVALGTGAEMPATEAASFGQQLIEIVPLNPVAALAETKMLSIIFTAILVGVGCILVGPPAKPLVDLFESAAAVFLKLVTLVMELAPFGVFALMAFAVGNDGLGAFVSILKVGLCVVIGVTIQLIVTHGLFLVRGLAGLNPVQFFRNVSEAMLMGFSTASSSATLPVVMQVADRKLGIGKPVVSTVLPLGASMSMDGTAMYMAILSMFTIQAFGIDLSIGQIILMAFVTMTVALGTAPIPGSSLFLVAGILATVGVSLEQAALVVAFVLPFDRPLDMIRTVPNVTSDLSVATVVAVKEQEIDLAVFRGEKIPA